MGAVRTSVKCFTVVNGSVMGTMRGVFGVGAGLTLGEANSFAAEARGDGALELRGDRDAHATSA